MLIVVSPAKTLDYESEMPTEHFSRPQHLKQSQLLINRMRDFSALDLMELQHVSSKIAELNVERNHQWKTPFTPKNARQAVFAFKGDVYTGPDAYSLDADDLEFARTEFEDGPGRTPGHLCRGYRHQGLYKRLP